MIETLLLVTGIVVWALVSAIVLLALPIIVLLILQWSAEIVKEQISDRYFEEYGYGDWDQIVEEKPKTAWVYLRFVRGRNHCYNAMMWYGGILETDVRDFR